MANRRIPGQRSRTPADTPEEKRERLEVSRALGHARRILGILRVLFVIDAVITALLLFLLLSFDLPVLHAAVGAVLVAALVGAVTVVRYPLPSTIVLALLHTLPALLFLALPAQGGLTGWSMIVLSALLWGAVAVAASTQHLLREYPDVWAARGLFGRGEATHPTGTKWRERARADRRGRWKKVALFVVLPFVLYVVAAQVIGPHSRSSGGSPLGGAGGGRGAEPESPLDPTLARFRGAWNAEDLAAVEAFVAPSEESRIVYLLRKVVRRRGWEDGRPRAAAPAVERVDPWRAYADFRLEGYGAMRTSWEWEEDAWVLVRIRLRPDRDGDGGAGPGEDAE